jgi:uncharacterized protein (TIGR02996 family)
MSRMSDDEDGIIVEQYRLGTRGMVRDGDWSGYGGTIVEDDDVYSYKVEIDVLGVPVQVQVNYLHFEATETIPVVSEEQAVTVASAALQEIVLSRANLADSIWWAQQAAARSSDDDLTTIHLPPLVDETEEYERALERLRAAPRDPACGAGFWIAEKVRSEHVGWVAQIDRGLLGLPQDAGREAVSEKLEAGRTLRARYEKAARATASSRYADDLAGTAPIAENPTLEAEIAREPSNAALYAVYADWLQGRGDPRGELIALQSGGRRSSRKARRFFAEHARYFCGGLDLETDDGVVSNVDWEHGFIARARVHTTRDHEDAGLDLAKTLRTILALPSTRFLQELEIGCASVHEEGGEQAIIDAFVAGGPRPSLRTLGFTTNGEEEMLSWTSTGLLSPIWPLVPELRKLVVNAGNLRLGVFELPQLRELEIETCGLDTQNVEDLLASSIAKLERLVLGFGSIERDACSPLAAATALLEEPMVPRLRELGLVNTEQTDELVSIVVRSPLFLQLHTLDLSEGTLTDDGAAALAKALPDATALRTLSVNECYLSNAGLALLERPGLEVKSTWQREAEEYEGQLHRYCATPE